MTSAPRGRAGPRPHHVGTLTMPVPYATRPQMQAQTVSAEQQLVGAMERIGLLDRQTDALKVKRANNSLAATRAQEVAGAARDRATEAKQVSEWGAWRASGAPTGVLLTGPTAQQVLDGPLRDRYRTAQELVQHRAQGARQAGSRAQQLRDEAAGLLRDTQGKLQRLRGEAGEGVGGWRWWRARLTRVPPLSPQRWRRRMSGTSGCWTPRRPSWAGWRPG